MDPFGNSDSGVPSFGGEDDSSSDEQSSNSNGTTNDAFFYEWLSFKQFWHQMISIYQPVETAVVALGLLGNLLALLTFFRSRKLSASPSFIYHRALVAADFIFCANYFLNLLVVQTMSVTCHRSTFRYWFGAFVDGTMNLLITNTCGYMIMYTTLVIALDRFVALLLFDRYRQWNTRRVAYAVTIVSFCLSIGLHSWASFVQHTVVEYRLSENRDDSSSIVDQPCWSEPVVYQWVKRENTTRTFERALVAKEYYNSVVRVGYPILLSIFTLGVIIGFARRQKRRQISQQDSDANTDRFVTANLLATTNNNITNHKTSTVCNATSTRTGYFSSLLNNFTSLANQHHRVVNRLLSPSVRHRQRCERALFYSMVSVVLLAFLQVASGESRRVLHLLFPPHEVLTKKVLNVQLPLEERLSNFRFLLYGHQATRIIANFCTAIDRSFICFLYMAMNNLFRRELLILISGAVRFSCPKSLWQRLVTSGGCAQGINGGGGGNSVAGADFRSSFRSRLDSNAGLASMAADVHQQIRLTTALTPVPPPPSPAPTGTAPVQ